MNFLTIIPARGGSKSIKNKNIKNFDKKPLIYWTLKAAKKSKYVKDLIISTDSKKIAKVCETYGFAVSSLRPKNLSTSSTPMLDVINYEVKKITKKNYDAVLLLQPTSPLRNFKDINNACKKFTKLEADSLVSICKLKHIYNPESLFTIKNDLLEKLKKKKLVSIRQKKKVYYHPNGAAIYITKISKINKYIIGGKLTYYLMKEKNSIDIDTNYDFKLAELVKKFSL